METALLPEPPHRPSQEKKSKKGCTNFVLCKNQPSEAKSGHYKGAAKQIEIPMPKHLAHFIRWEYQEKIPKLSRILLYSHTHYPFIREYFDKADQLAYPLVMIEMKNPSQSRQYFLVRHLEELFRSRMIEYLVFSRHTNARDALKEFLFVHLDLQDGDYNVESAYKDFQRKRDLIRRREEIYMAGNRVIAIGGQG